MPTLFDRHAAYRQQDHFECNLLMTRINALLTSQSLFVAAASFLYNDKVNARVTITAVAIVACATAIIAFAAIWLGGGILMRWHELGQKLVDSDSENELRGCHLPDRRLPDRIHRVSINAFGLSLPFIFLCFWIAAIAWVQGWIN
jgi:hypothetical protein